MRRMRWNAPNALECAGLRRIAPIAPIAAIAPNCAVCALFAPNCAGIALEFCLQPATQPYTHGWRSLVATSLLAACSFRAVPVVPGFLWLTTPPVPAVLRFFFNCQSCRETNNAGQKLNNFYCLPFSFFFWRETTNLASIDVLLVLCAHPEFCAHFGTVLGLLYIHNIICA